MNLKSTAISIVCLIVGLLVGRMLPDSSPTPPQDVTPQENVTRPARDGSHTTYSHHEPEDRKSLPDGGQSTDTSPENLENGAMINVPVELIYSLSIAAGPRKIDQDLFSGDGAVEEALEITDHEKAVIQTAWRDSLGKIRDIEASSIQTEAIDEWSQRITLPELSPSMASLGSGFSSQVRNALGEDRGEAFLAAKQVERMFAGPIGERAFTVTTEEVGDGQWRFRIELESGDGRRMWVGENIPAELRHLTDAAGISPALAEQSPE